MRKVEIKFSRTYIRQTTIEVNVPDYIADEHIEDYLIDHNHWEQDIENNLEEEESEVKDDNAYYYVYENDKPSYGGTLI